MNKWLSTVALAAAWAGGLWTPSAVAAEGKLRVDDKAGAFTADGVKKAEAAFRATAFKSPTHFTVVTVNTIPEAKKADFDRAAKNPAERSRFFAGWARELAREQKETGVFALMFVDDKRYITEVVADRQTDVYRGFADDDATRVARLLNDGAKAALGKTGDTAKAARDEGLLKASEFVANTLKNTSAPAGKAKADAGHAVTDHAAGGGGGGFNLGSLLCMGLVALLGVWLVVALIRAFTGGGGYGGGGYGGGGGGFFPSLLGGLFGAAAGMYLYDQFFSGGASDLSAGGSTASDLGDTGAGDYDAGASGGDAGGDWGDAGGDAGGGDWGGGGDFGGGDW